MNIRKKLIPLTILCVAVVTAIVIVKNPPQARRFTPSAEPQIAVETLPLRLNSYQIMLESYGTVRPRTQSVLVSQVSGQINYVNPQFRDGGFFEQGEVLVRLDDRDYKAELKIAESSLIAANQRLLEEQARAKQAIIDWKRLGNDSTPNALVLREPQLESARANVLSAEAQLEKATLALERSTIVAPYAGRVLRTNVDLGQVVSNNGQLAEIFAIDFVEIRLPVNNNDLALIDLPEEFRDNFSSHTENTVTLRSDLLGDQRWVGSIVRTEGAIDNSSQELYIVAQVEDPYDAVSNRGMPIKIGQYVSAEISGKRLDDVIVIPNSAIYQGSYVYTVVDGALLRKDIAIRWQNASEAIVRSGLNEGDKLVLTPLGQVSSGTPVSILGEESTGEVERDSSRQSKSDIAKQSNIKASASTGALK